jgi:hypothetical protein
VLLTLSARNGCALPVPVAPTLERRASVKLFLSLQFLNPRQSVELLGRGDQPVGRLNADKDRIALNRIRTHDPSVRASEDSQWSQVVLILLVGGSLISAVILMREKKMFI